MNVEEVVTYVKNLFGDTSGTQITEEDIIRWINSAQEQIVMHSETVLEAVTDINLVAGQQEYDFPSDLLVLRSIRLKSNSSESYQALKSYSLQMFDNHISKWQGEFHGRGSPYIYTTYEKRIFLFPTPQKSITGGLRILYSQTPTEVSTVLDSLSLPRSYHEAVVKYCMSQANALDENYEAKAMNQADFQNDVRILSNKHNYGAREFYPTITVLQDDM